MNSDLTTRLKNCKVTILLLYLFHPLTLGPKELRNGIQSTSSISNSFYTIGDKILEIKGGSADYCSIVTRSEAIFTSMFVPLGSTSTENKKIKNTAKRRLISILDE